MKPKPNPHAQALGRLGGLRRTPAQIEAARRNGAKGGRPLIVRASKPPKGDRKQIWQGPDGKRYRWNGQEWVDQQQKD